MYFLPSSALWGKVGFEFDYTWENLFELMRMLPRWDTFLSTQKFEALEKLVFFTRKHANKNRAAIGLIKLFD